MGGWDKGGTEPEDDQTLIYGNGNANNHFFVHKTFKKLLW